MKAFCKYIWSTGWKPLNSGSTLPAELNGELSLVIVSNNMGYDISECVKTCDTLLGTGYGCLLGGDMAVYILNKLFKIDRQAFQSATKRFQPNNHDDAHVPVMGRIGESAFWSRAKHVKVLVSGILQPDR
jgi:hypothetical protein